MPRAARDTVLLLAALALCPVAAFVIGDDPGGPIRRAEALAELERALGVHVEPAVQGWALGQPGLMAAAGVFYVGAHVPVAAWALIWTWCLRRDRFPLVRDVFLLTQALCVALYAVAPTAPPRLVPGAGVEDTLTGLWGRAVADSAHLLQSPYAAMPSGHVAFALVAGGTFAALGDRRWLRAFGWLYPPVVVAVTVVTGHHVWLDAAASAVVVALAVACARGVRARRRRSPPATTPAPNRRPHRPGGGGPAPAAGPAGRS
jgi:membrane-associated phospholipid phosphatase